MQCHRRSARALQTIAILLTLVFSTTSSADTVISVLWENTGTDTLNTTVGATERAEIWVETDMEGLLGLSLSLGFDEAGENLVDVVFSEEYAYAAGEVANLSSWTQLTAEAGILTDSELGSSGLLKNVEGIAFVGGPADFTFLFASVEFLTNAAGSTELIPGLFDIADFAVDNDSLDIPSSELVFNGATLTIPEPTSACLVGLAVSGLLLHRRRSAQ